MWRRCLELLSSLCGGRDPPPPRVGSSSLVCNSPLLLSITPSPSPYPLTPTPDWFGPFLLRLCHGLRSGVFSPTAPPSPILNQRYRSTAPTLTSLHFDRKSKYPPDLSMITFLQSPQPQRYPPIPRLVVTHYPFPGAQPTRSALLPPPVERPPPEPPPLSKEIPMCPNTPNTIQRSSRFLFLNSGLGEAPSSHPPPKPNWKKNGQAVVISLDSNAPIMRLLCLFKWPGMIFLEYQAVLVFCNCFRSFGIQWISNVFMVMARDRIAEKCKARAKNSINLICFSSRQAVTICAIEPSHLEASDSRSELVAVNMIRNWLDSKIVVSPP